MKILFAVYIMQNFVKIACLWCIFLFFMRNADVSDSFVDNYCAKFWTNSAVPKKQEEK